MNKVKVHAPCRMFYNTETNYEYQVFQIKIDFELEICDQYEVFIFIVA